LCSAILLMLASGRYLNRTGKMKAAALVGDIQGKRAPDFELPSLDGKLIKLSDYRGKAVVLNFWATWCSPCKEEMPWFVDLQKKYGNDGLVVLGIAMDDSETPKIAEFAHNMGVNYPVLLGTDKVSEDYGNVQFLPTSFYIDRDGKFIGKGVGMVGRKDLEDNVQKALASRAVDANAPAHAEVKPKVETSQSTSP
jgi:cytochrome c biogenesis protein CcmG/thiol:disulfide interchange protein DsbE